MFKNNKRKSKKILNKFLILSGLFATLNMPLVKAMPNNKNIKQQINNINENKPEPKNNLNNIKKADSKKNEKKIKIYDMEYKNKQNKKSTFSYTLEDIENKELPENLKIRNDLTLNVNSNKKYDLNSQICENILKYNGYVDYEQDKDFNFENDNIQKLTQLIKSLYNTGNYYLKILEKDFNEFNNKNNLKIDFKKDKETTDLLKIYPLITDRYNITYPRYPINLDLPGHVVIPTEENKSIKEMLDEMKIARSKYVKTVNNLIKMLNKEKTNRNENKQNFNNLGYYLLNLHATKLQKECIDTLKREQIIFDNTIRWLFHSLKEDTINSVMKLLKQLDLLNKNEVEIKKEKENLIEKIKKNLMGLFSKSDVRDEDKIKKSKKYLIREIEENLKVPILERTINPLMNFLNKSDVKTEEAIEEFKKELKKVLIKEFINCFALVRNLYLNEYSLTIEEKIKQIEKLNIKAEDLYDFTF